jgi:ribosomal protein S18 acetylase RimI-like enzyme
LIGAVMVGYDGHRGWINYLAVHPDHRGVGWAVSLWRPPSSGWRSSAARE